MILSMVGIDSCWLGLGPEAVWVSVKEEGGCSGPALGLAHSLEVSVSQMETPRPRLWAPHPGSNYNESEERWGLFQRLENSKGIPEMKKLPGRGLAKCPASLCDVGLVQHLLAPAEGETCGLRGQ